MKRTPEEDPFYETEKVASATECTGLMPSLPITEEENAQYAMLYATHDAKESDEKKNDKKKKR